MMNESVLREYTTSKSKECTIYCTIYVTSPKNQGLISFIAMPLDEHELLVSDTSILPTQQFCWIFTTAQGVASHLPVLTCESFLQLLIFLNHKWQGII